MVNNLQESRVKTFTLRDKDKYVKIVEFNYD